MATERKFEVGDVVQVSIPEVVTGFVVEVSNDGSIFVGYKSGLTMEYVGVNCDDEDIKLSKVSYAKELSRLTSASILESIWTKDAGAIIRIKLYDNTSNQKACGEEFYTRLSKFEFGRLGGFMVGEEVYAMWDTTAQRINLMKPNWVIREQELEPGATYDPFDL